MGGIVGLTQSSITSSTNEGIVDVNVVTSNSSIFSGKNYPINVGGISGGSGSVTYCKNTGTIDGHLSIEDGNIGGIIGWLDKGHKFEYNESYCTLSNTRAPGTRVLQRLVALSVSTVTMIAAQVRVAVVRLGATSLMTIAMRSGMVCFWVTSGQHLIQLFWVLRMSLSSFLVVA